jgi:hypothetical protein
MRSIVYRLFFIIAVFINLNASAQGHFEISGKVTGENNEPVKGAIVFISGSEKRTVSDDAGQFTLSNLDPGTFQLSIQILGYFPYTQNIVVQDKSVNLNVPLKVKSIVLKEVSIGSNNAWAGHFKMFKDQFLGITGNGQRCIILNPEVIHFGTQKIYGGKILLTADADEFLIIENKQLGYRIRYQLKAFTFNEISGITSYDGDTNFEDLEGDEAAKKDWAANRLAAYRGSLMHYLRSVYSNTALQEGFSTHQIYVAKSRSNMYIEPREVKFDTVVTRVSNSLISLRFTSFYVIYDPQRTVNLTSANPDTNAKTLTDATNASELKLYLDQALVDAKGNYTDYRTFLRRNTWGRKRIGDQLPFEYQPPDKVY